MSLSGPRCSCSAPLVSRHTPRSVTNRKPSRNAHLTGGRTGGRERGWNVGAKDEERNHVQPAPVHEDRRLAIEEVADRTAFEWEVLVASVRDHRSEVQSALEPR